MKIPLTKIMKRDVITLNCQIKMIGNHNNSKINGILSCLQYTFDCLNLELVAKKVSFGCFRTKDYVMNITNIKKNTETFLPVSYCLLNYTLWKICVKRPSLHHFIILYSRCTVPSCTLRCFNIHLTSCTLYGRCFDVLCQLG